MNRFNLLQQTIVHPPFSRHSRENKQAKKSRQGGSIFFDTMGGPKSSYAFVRLPSTLSQRVTLLHSLNEKYPTTAIVTEESGLRRTPHPHPPPLDYMM